MDLRVGDLAPDFLALDVQGRRVRLGTQRGRCVLLAFLHDAADPASRRQLTRLVQARDLLQEARASAVAFFPAPRDHLRALVGAGIPGLPVVPDLQGRVYRLYGVKQRRARLPGFAQVRARLEAGMQAEAAGLRVPPTRRLASAFLPAQFLVDADGRLRFVHLGKTPADVGPPPDLVLLAARQEPVSVSRPLPEAVHAPLQDRAADIF